MSKNIAVIGCGYWGKNLVRVFSELGVLHSICDSNDACQAALKIHGPAPRFTNDLDVILQDDEIDAVAVATPAATHAAVVEKCLRAGKDVFVEKPLALTCSDGQALVDLAKEKSRILMVGHILLYHPAVLKLKQLIEEGSLGRILYTYSNRLNMGLIRTEENILWSFAPHDISVMLHLLGEEPDSCEAEGQSYLTKDVVDVTLSRLKFKSGATAHIFVSWLHPEKEQKLVVVGSEQMAVFDDTAADKLVLYPHRVDWVDRVPRAVKANAVVVELEASEPLKAECQHFLDCLDSRQTPRSDGQEGLRVLRVLDACQQSMLQPRTERAVNLSPPPIPPKENAFQAHASAYIDEPCSIGDGTNIWHFSHVMAGASIGANCKIGQNVVIASKSKIGDGVKIQNNVSVYDGVTLEDNVFCGPSCVFTNVMNPRSKIQRQNEYRPTLVKTGASLGANSTIICGITIGAYAFIAAGAVVNRDVPAFSLVAGVPAKQIGWICQCGERLNLDDSGEAVCFECGQHYQLDSDEQLQQCDATHSKSQF